MANELGLTKKTVFAKQSGLGTPATTGGKIKRRTSAVFDKASDTYENNEIVSHQQSTGKNESVTRTSGKLNGLLSAGTYFEQFASLLRQDFAAVPDLTGLSITIAGSGPSYTITRGSGSFLTGGIKVGMTVRLTAGSFNAANSNVNVLVIAMTATVLTVIVPNDAALVAEGPIASATLSVPGKVTYAPMTGHTNDYWTVEELYTVNTKSEVFEDVKIASAQVTIPASGNCTVAFDCPGLARKTYTSQQIGSPAAETTTGVLTAAKGKIVVNGSAITVTGIQFTIDGQIQPGEAEVGNSRISDHVRGRIKVSGQMTAKFSNTTLRDLRDAQTRVPLITTATDGSAGTADLNGFTFPTIKIFTDTPDDGETKEVIRTYQWEAEIPSTGGSGVSQYQSICMLQDSQAS